MEVPKTFNWVEARAKCSVDVTFMALTEVVISDVAAAKNVIGSNETLRIEHPADGKIIIIRGHFSGSFAINAGVVFERGKSAITVKKAEPNAKPFLTATPELDLFGGCRLVVDGEKEPLELWQFTRRALEGLFFE